LLYVAVLDDYITISSDFRGRFGGVVYVKVSQLMLAAVVAAAGLIAFADVAQAAPAPISASVACVNGDGVISLTLANPSADTGAEFVITNPQTFVASIVDLAPGASQLVTLDGLSDGSVVVPVQLDGVDASVTSQISCDPLVCTEGALSTVTDQSGVQHQACVASAAEAPVAPVRASLATRDPQGVGHHPVDTSHNRRGHWRSGDRGGAGRQRFRGLAVESAQAGRWPERVSAATADLVAFRP